MTQPSSQNFSNRARYVPLYHFVLGLILMVLLGWSGRRMASHFSIDTLCGHSQLAST